jgi:hypothetical protein
VLVNLPQRYARAGIAALQFDVLRVEVVDADEELILVGALLALRPTSMLQAARRVPFEQLSNVCVSWLLAGRPWHRANPGAKEHFVLRHGDSAYAVPAHRAPRIRAFAAEWA